MKPLRYLTPAHLLAGFTALCCPLAATTAYAADEDNASETAAARSLAIDGMRLAQAGKCEEASEKLKRAEELHHSQIVLGRLGECYVAIGRVVEGTEALRRMLREPLPENATPALAQAYERAQGVLEAAKPRIAALNLAVDLPQKVNAKVLVDGKEISAAVLGADLPADPGRHTVSVSAPGYITATQDVTIDAGGRQVVSLKLVKDPNAVIAEPTPLPSSPHAESQPAAGGQPRALHTESPPPSRVEEGGSMVPAYLSWIVGAAGLGVGIGFGVSALSAKNDLELKCPEQQCDPRFQGDLNDAKQKGNIATIGFAVGGAGIVLGTIFFAASGSDEPDPTTAQASSSIAAYRPRAWLTPGGVHFAADF